MLSSYVFIFKIKHSVSNSIRGKVNVKSKSGKELVLSPDNKATILSDGLIEESSVNAEEYVLWTEGILSLNNDLI